MNPAAVTRDPRQANWPWWWKIAAVAVMIGVASVKPLIEHWLRYPAPLRELIWWPGLAIWAFTSLWLFVIVPAIDAAHPNRAWAESPRRHADTLRVIVGLPAFLLFLSALLLGVVFPVVHYLDRGLWIWGAGRMSLTILPMIILAALYARFMGAHLQRRVRRSAQEAGLCYECGYPAGNTRCPECGA